MIIANPIYDSVFKYLLEDLDIAKGLLSIILNEDIETLEVKPQETTTEIQPHAINIFRLDFKAVIKKPNGDYKKALIELQKAKHILDIMRFRRYLADNYQKEDTIVLANGTHESMPLPIVTIYFLGFSLTKGFPSVFKMGHRLVDVFNGEELTNRPKEPFVDLLNHESYTIQIPLLKDDLKTRLAQTLMVFNQKYVMDDMHKLDFQGDVQDPFVQKILDRLNRAIANEDVRKTMDIEDEIENTISKLLRAKDLVIEDKDKELEEKGKELEEKDKKLEEKGKELEEKDKELEQKDKELEQKDKELEQREAYIADLLRKLNEK